MDGISDALYDECLDAIATELHARDRAAGLAPANRTARAPLDKARETLDERLSIVSGKQVISKLSAWSQLEFGIAIGSRALARHITANEIAVEVNQVLASIEAASPFIAPAPRAMIPVTVPSF
jgi:hypothetical protein